MDVIDRNRTEVTFSNRNRDYDSFAFELFFGSSKRRHRLPRLRGFEVSNFQIDGIGLPFATGDQLGDLDTVLYDRVEILRGANGLVTATGNPSATVNFVRKRPTAGSAQLPRHAALDVLKLRVMRQRRRARAWFTRPCSA